MVHGKAKAKLYIIWKVAIMEDEDVVVIVADMKMKSLCEMLGFGHATVKMLEVFF